MNNKAWLNQIFLLIFMRCFVYKLKLELFIVSIGTLFFFNCYFDGYFKIQFCTHINQMAWPKRNMCPSSAMLAKFWPCNLYLFIFQENPNLSLSWCLIIFKWVIVNPKTQSCKQKNNEDLFQNFASFLVFLQNFYFP